MAYTPYEPGYYKCVVKDQRFGESKNKHTPYFEVDVVVQSKVDIVTKKEIPVEHHTRTSDPMYITDGTMDFFPSQVMALGFQGDDLRQLDPDQPGCQKLAGNEVIMRCTHRQADDKTYDKFEVHTEGGGRNRPNNPKVSKTLNNVFGDRFRKAISQPTEGSVMQPKAEAQVAIEGAEAPTKPKSPF